jgi:hypothetical protein
MLAIDVVLGALIGPRGCAAEMVIERAESGEWTPVLLDFALFCAAVAFGAARSQGDSRPSAPTMHERLAC